MWRIPLFDLDYGVEEETAVLEVLRSRWISMGEVTLRFEREFAEHLQVKHAFAVANGTVALHLAYAAAGIRPGDEVIVPTQTFVATASAVRYLGANVVFADCQSENDLCVSAQSIHQAITPRTRAIVVMHYGGNPCDMDAIQQIADEHGLLVVEDAAHAPGGFLGGRAMGGWGRSAAFSFFSNKNLATGEGGMVTTNDDATAEIIRQMRSHGMTSLTWDRYRGQAQSYDVTRLGYNYRPTEITCALGLVQLHKLERNNSRRRQLMALYHSLLERHTPELTLPFRQPRGLHTAHILPVLLPARTDRPGFMNAMKEQGIQTSIHYPFIPRFSAYHEETQPTPALPVARLVAEREVTLPLYPMMTDEDVQSVVLGVRQALDQ